jgi:predicted  nucleic acid-binding Zn-ribbon protein
MNELTELMLRIPGDLATAEKALAELRDEIVSRQTTRDEVAEFIQISGPSIGEQQVQTLEAGLERLKGAIQTLEDYEQALVNAIQKLQQTVSGGGERRIH